MARVQLSKAGLAKEQQNLVTFERFLPSLDLKRQQLMAVRETAFGSIAKTNAEIEETRRDVARRLPMLAYKEIDLDDLAKVTGFELDTENVVGVRLPRLRRIEAEIRLALEEDGAEAIVLGCSGMANLAKRLTDRFGLPVLEGVTCATALIEALAGLGLKTSKIGGYAAPPSA